ncbi:MAG: hypothetical protein A2161_02160 [Candidatus Schekmanbacteria bacterium RBG_13_48_7]|uniref:Uncharacterized protein n=1 Tax=Candidatus Schekmanbacteria bacterium RBG_13_48_7 TaxID=1817878 RepID=A0A1F7RTE4_9BACT|nr:MAG: hypothetical protein A2161_02160 [Candidatus Schekmanbacteria bacterium RBG_13_48_7]
MGIKFYIEKLLSTRYLKKFTILFLLIFFSWTISIYAQTFLTADIEKPFYTSTRINSSLSNAFFTGAISGSYCYRDYLQFFFEAGLIKIDLGSELDIAEGFFLTGGVKNKYYSDHPEGIPLDMAWFLELDTYHFSKDYQSHELDFRVMLLRLGHIFSKHLGIFEPYNSYGIVYSLNDYDGPSSAEHHIPNNIDFYANAGIRLTPFNHLALTGEVFLFQKPGVGVAIEIFF